ncbi:hypothetical protein [Streptomyces sp. 2A115]
MWIEQRTIRPSQEVWRAILAVNYRDLCNSASSTARWWVYRSDAA